MDHPDERALPGLYIHIPFCLKKCDYCGFYSVTDRTLIPDFLAALRREMELYRNPYREFDTVYIGGGTPSVLDPADLIGLIADLRTAFTIQPAAEITIEVNPGDVTVELLSGLRGSGVNRLNVGCQSFDDTVLASLGRRHTARQAREAVEMAHRAGFDNLGIDLIYGLPVLPAGQLSHTAESSPLAGPAASHGFHPTGSLPAGVCGPPPASGSAFDTWLASLETAISLQPEHLSCYQLTVETNTPLAERCQKNEVVLPCDDLQSRFFFRTSEILEAAGYLHYEVSNFAREDQFRSHHNSKYWNHASYLGLGPAAHSFNNRKRWWNYRSVAAYLKGLSDGKPPIAGSETLTDQELRLEALFLGLRTQRGIRLEDFKRRYGQDLLAEKHEVLTKLINEALVEIRNGFLRPTRAGMAVADSLALI
jgi:oxygen-independent coproporphyrinogen III oxidase